MTDLEGIMMSTLLEGMHYRYICLIPFPFTLSLTEPNTLKVLDVSVDEELSATGVYALDRGLHL